MRFFLFILTGFISLHLLLACNKQSINTPVPGVQNGVDTFKNMLALGDSYTIGEAVSDTDRYPVQTTSILRSKGIFFNSPEIIAITGWTTANLLHKLTVSPPVRPSYDIVTLLIGVNNQFQGLSQDTYRTEFTQLINKAIQYACNRSSHVIVLSIPDWGVTPYAIGGLYNQQLIARQIDSFNVINKDVSVQAGVNYIDITGDSRMAANDLSLIAYDGLHFSGKEYRIWAMKLEAVVRMVL